MRLAMAAFADAANVREDTMSVLSAGVNEILRPAYPAPMGLTLALMLEFYPEDDDEQIEVRVTVKQVPGSEDVKPVLSLRAELQLTGPRDGIMYVPMPLDLRNRQIPSAGRYEVEIAISGMDIVTLSFVAHQLDSEREDEKEEPSTRSDDEARSNAL